MLGWMTHKLEDCQEKYQNFRYADDPTLMTESEEKLKRFLMRVKARE